MHIITTIIVGFIVGLIARAIMPGNHPMGFIWTTVLGVVGSVVASYLGRMLHLYNPGDTASWFASILGAILVLFVVGMITRRRTPNP